MKQIVTRKLKKELKNAVNPLEEILIIIKQYFPKLTEWIDNLTDTRNQSYVEYNFILYHSFSNFASIYLY